MEAHSLFSSSHPLIPPVACMSVRKPTVLAMPAPNTAPPAATRASSSLTGSPSYAKVVSNRSNRVDRWFSPLAEGTNLNKAPSNWLQYDDRISKADPYQLFPVLPSGSREIQELPSSQLASISFGPAEPDFLAPAENLKKLFRMPYTKGSIALNVHKVGSTLIVDTVGQIPHNPFASSSSSSSSFAAAGNEQHGRQTQQDGQDIDATPSNTDSSSVPTDFEQQQQRKKKKNRTKVLNKQLMSKFLYHSISTKPIDMVSSSSGHDNVSMINTQHTESSTTTYPSGTFPEHSSLTAEQQQQQQQSARSPQCFRDTYSSESDGVGPESTRQFTASNLVAETSLPLSRLYAPWESIPRPPKKFATVTEWQFQGFRLLLGSDMLIFRNQHHPAVSLKLMEVDEKINALTCLDLWLDNIMAAVPELAICYHKEGFVKGYELVKTEDIPRMQGKDRNCTFRTDVVEEHALHVLHFLKENCTREAGSYWLVREAASDVLKLYDASAISESEHSDEGLSSTGTVTAGKNSNSPFAFPVAMLCYRLASRLANTDADISNKKKLLKKCVELLSANEHPAILASAQEALADTHLIETFRQFKRNGRRRKQQQENNAAAGNQSQRKKANKSTNSKAKKKKHTTTTAGLTVNGSVTRLNGRVVSDDDEESEGGGGGEHSASDDDLDWYMYGMGGKLRSARKSTMNRPEKEKGKKKTKKKKQSSESRIDIPFTSVFTPELLSELRSIPSTSSSSASSSTSTVTGIKNDLIDIDSIFLAAEYLLQSYRLVCDLRAPNVNQLKDLRRKLAECFYLLALFSYNEKAVTISFQRLKIAEYFLNIFSRHTQKLTIRYLRGVIYSLFGDIHRELPHFITTKYASTPIPSASSTGVGSQTDSTSTTRKDITPAIDSATRFRADLLDVSYLELPVVDEKLLLTFLSTAEWSAERRTSLSLCHSAYRQAQEYLRPDVDPKEHQLLVRKIGSVSNDFGQLLFSEGQLDKAQSLFEESLAAFEATKDNINTALLYCNLARIYRNRALKPSTLVPFVERKKKDKKLFVHGDSQQTVTLDADETPVRSGLTAEQISHYQISIDLCQKGISSLGTRDTHPQVWDNLHRELANHILGFGVHRMQQPPVESMSESISDTERIVIDSLCRSLHIYESINALTEVGIVHYHLGNTYFAAALRALLESNSKDDMHRARTKMKLALRHLERSIFSFQPNSHPVDYIRIQLKMAELYETFASHLPAQTSSSSSSAEITSTVSSFSTSSAVSNSNKKSAELSYVGHIEKALTTVLATSEALAPQVIRMLTKRNDGSLNALIALENDIDKVLTRLLRSLIKCSTSGIGSNAGSSVGSGGPVSDESSRQLYRDIYRLSLNRNSSLFDRLSAIRSAMAPVSTTASIPSK